MSLCCAYLRVYQAIDEFSPLERERVEALLDDRDDQRQPQTLELIAPAERREAFQKLVDGKRYVCPARTRLRSLLGILAFGQQAFVSSEELSAARRELRELDGERPFLLQSPWHVPVRWFAAFDDAERRIQHDEHGLSLRYETTAAQALERLGRAVVVLRDGAVHPAMVGMVHELNQWLGSFSRSAIVELDYASVARLFEPDELADDHSAADVWHAIEAVARADALRAGLYYQRVNERWAPKRARESLN